MRPPAEHAPRLAGAARGSSRTPGAQPAARVPAALDEIRTTFIEAMRKETPGTDLPRYVAVLDALLAWAGERSSRLALRPAARRADLIRFDRAGTKASFCSIQAPRAGAPTVEIHLAPSRPSSAEHREEVLRTLNAHSRIALVEGDRLRIGFGALKNAAALAAVLAVMDRLLASATTADDAPG